VIIGPQTLILLDTSVVLHLARNDLTGKSIESQYSLTSRRERPLISSVTEGELLALAYSRQWGQRKIDALHEMLGNFVRVDAGLPEIVEWYAKLFAEARIRGASRGQNDLWIAATAKAVGAVLLTCDKDFDWLHPDHVHVVRVENAH